MIVAAFQRAVLVHVDARGEAAIVRDRVQQVVRADRRVSQFAFAPSSQGGTGVTIVEFGPR